MGTVATTDSGLWHTYSATAVQWSDRQGLQHGVKLVGVVWPLGYSGSTLPYTVDFLVLIVLLVLGVVLLVPLLLVLVALGHCWTRRQFRRKKYVHHIGSLDELSVIFKTTPSGLHPLPYGYLPTTAVVADIQKSQYDTVTPDLSPSRSGTLRSAFSGYHSRQMSGSDFLNALSLTDVESVGNSVDLSSVQQKKSRRLSFKRSFPFLNITTYEDAERSETLKKAYSYDTGLDAEMALAGKQSEDAVSLRTSLYNILDDFDSRWNIDGVNTSDVSADDM